MLYKVLRPCWVGNQKLEPDRIVQLYSVQANPLVMDGLMVPYERPPEPAAEPVEADESPPADVEAEPTAKPSRAEKRARRRAHGKDGHFASDDPSTPEVNEAWTDA